MHRHIGIYAGTFDPIHDGHLALAQAAIDEARLDSIYFMPETSPRSKIDMADIEIRAMQIKKAISANVKMQLLHADDKKFTVSDTLPKLQKLFPYSKLSFLIGSDVLRHLGGWNNISDLVESAAFIIGLRDNDTEEFVKNEISEIEKRCKTLMRYIVVATHHKDVSSTKIKLAS